MPSLEINTKQKRKASIHTNIDSLSVHCKLITSIDNPERIKYKISARLIKLQNVFKEMSEHTPQ